jgi:hypothetical protein
MYPPDRDIDVLFAQRQRPGHDMVVDTVDQRAVEVEEEGGLGASFHGHSLISAWSCPQLP